MQKPIFDSSYKSQAFRQQPQTKGSSNAKVSLYITHHIATSALMQVFITPQYMPNDNGSGSYNNLPFVQNESHHLEHILATGLSAKKFKKNNIIQGHENIMTFSFLL